MSPVAHMDRGQLEALIRQAEIDNSKHRIEIARNDQITALAKLQLVFIELEEVPQ